MEKSRFSEFISLIKRTYEKLPLFFLLVASILIMSLIGCIGQATRLKKFSGINFTKEPFFAVLAFQVKDIQNGDEDVMLPASILKNPVTTQKVSKAQLKKEKKALKERQVIPQGVNTPVVPAVDYGVTNRGIMVDESTVFTTDLKGLFAPDGTYRYLTKAKNDDYFKDALFIGDSRTVGLSLWSDLTGHTNFFCKESMSTIGIRTKELTFTGVNGESSSMTLDSLLSTHKFNKVYISLGINEMGYPVMDYYKAYRELVTKIHTAYPDALIFIQGNMHVGIGSSQTNATFNNTNLVQRNTAIASLANGRNIFYIDPNTAVCDSDGNLIAEYTTDEIHLKAAYYNKWVQYLRENTIDPTVKPMTVEETKAAKEAKKNANEKGLGISIQVYKQN